MTQVKTRYGTLSGLSAHGVTEFRGVPFAAPAVGEFRFMGPQPVVPWDGVRAADKHPPAALQEKNPLMGIETMDDDCLYLNLWVPEGEGPFPVMVWFHGGGYLSGSPSQLLYHGERLAREQQVIVVNAAYRLGFMGFAHLQNLVPGLKSDTNRGLRDQIAALQWVNDNIAYFGGDPGAVTIFGESAGGFSVASLLAAPAADDLFHRAIVQSGAGDMVLAADESERIVALVLEALPGEGSAADRLRQASGRDIVKAQRAALRQLVQRGIRSTTPQFAMVFMPVVEPETLPVIPVDSVAAGCCKHKPLMAGVCRDEWNLFQYAAPFNGGVGLDRLKALSEAEIRHRFDRALPEHASLAWDYYRQSIQPHPQRGLLDCFTAMESDRLFRVPTERLLSAQANAGGDVWGFEFTWQTEAFGVPLGACHVVDIPFVFNSVDTPMGQLFVGQEPEAKALAANVSRIWGHFAHGQAPDWSQWKPEGDVRYFGNGEQAGKLFNHDRIELWRDVIRPDYPAGSDGR